MTPIVHCPRTGHVLLVQLAINPTFHIDSYLHVTPQQTLHVEFNQFVINYSFPILQHRFRYALLLELDRLPVLPGLYAGGVGGRGGRHLPDAVRDVVHGDHRLPGRLHRGHAGYDDELNDNFKQNTNVCHHF